MVQKLDVAASIAAIREAAEHIGATPGQSPCELAVNRDGIPALLAFTEWVLRREEDLPDVNDLCDATGMLVGSFVMGVVAHFEEDDRPLAANRVLRQLMHVVTTRLTATGDEYGDVIVPIVNREVGDA